MVRFDWAMTILGYAPHALSASAVVGVSHMPTHDALRFARNAGLGHGWIHSSDPQPQLEGVPEGKAVAVDLGSLFKDQRIAYTEGVVSGAVVFVAAGDREPPEDRDLVTWAEELGLPWVRVVDNEVAYWGAVDDALAHKLLRWFCAQHPINDDWQVLDFEQELGAELHRGLFAHGWTRNVSLAEGGRRASQDLWGGIHRESMLEHDAVNCPRTIQHGIRLSRRDDGWEGAIIDDCECPLNDDTGRVVQPI